MDMACSTPKQVRAELRSDDLMSTLRPIHMYNHVTQALTQSTEEQSNTGVLGDYVSGVVSARRWEEVIVIQSANCKSV